MDAETDTKLFMFFSLNQARLTVLLRNIICRASVGIIVICDRHKTSALDHLLPLWLCRLLYKADLKSLYHNGEHSI